VRFCGLDAYGSKQGIVMGSCGYGNETSGFVRGGEFLDQLTDHQLLKIPE
jgi:hypothetical protein